MKRLNKILVPIDLTEKSLRAFHYGCWLAAEDKATMVILHVANGLNPWGLYCEDLAIGGGKPWPLDRVLSEASLDLSRFLEPQLHRLSNVPAATKRVVLGSVAEQNLAIAEEEKIDLIVMSPGRQRGLRHLFGGVTERVTRSSPCPVLSITAPQPSRSWRGTLKPPRFGWRHPRVADI
jgi:nucleotide-binding universal stress UspA family protein